LEVDETAGGRLINEIVDHDLEFTLENAAALEGRPDLLDLILPLDSVSNEELIRITQAAPPVLVDPALLQASDTFMRIAVPSSAGPSAGPSSAAIPSVAKPNKGKKRKQPRSHLLDDTDSDVDEEDANEPLSIPTGPLKMVLQLIFRDESADFALISQRCAALPKNSVVLRCCRPGHAPINGTCPFCGKHLGDPPIATDPKQASRRAGWIAAAFSHTNNCAAIFARNHAATRMLARYPQKVHGNPFSNVGQWYMTGQMSTNLHSLFHRSRLAAKGVPICLKCTAPVYCPAQAREHLVLAHNISIPASPSVASKTEWSVQAAGFPLPTYFSDINRYIADPKELAQYCIDLYGTRISDPAEKVVKYGIWSELLVPEGYLTDDASQTVLPMDDKYRWIPSCPGKRCIPAQDGLCILCSNNTHKPFTDRMQPSNTTREHYKEHFRDCFDTFCREVASLDKLHAEGKPPPVIYTPYWTDGRVACPDPCCRAQGKDYDGAHSLSLHLAGVHRCTLRGNEAFSGQKRLEDFAFLEKKDFDKWLQDRKAAREKKKKKKASKE